MKKETDSKNKIQCGEELSSGPAKHKSFVLFTSLRSNIRYLSLKDKGMLFDAILDYADGVEKCAVEKSLPNSAKIVFSFVSDQMDANFEKYEQMREIKRKAANKRWGKTEDDARASSALHNENVNVTENENVTENVTENGKKEEINSSSSSSNNDSDGVAKKEEDEEEEKISNFSKKTAEGWMSFFKDTLNINESKIPPPKFMTPERARSLYFLLKKYGRDIVADVFRRAAKKPFLNGSGKNKFVANFDWLLEEKNFLKVYEDKFYG